MYRMANRKKNRWAGIVFGPVLVFAALSAIWKNETRFDYHRAAAKTKEIVALGEALSGDLMSFTGDMNRELTMSGEYVDSFTGYLSVKRHAEIYAWDKDESDDSVTWKKKWMSSLESNSRNNSLTQELESRSFLPPDYEVGELKVTSDKIEFVDSNETIAAGSLTLKRSNLEIEGSEHLYLRKNRNDELGDERVSYSGVPVPETATYFGKFESQLGVPDTTHQRTGMINQMIQDSGILHHIVAGDREAALTTMKAHIGRLKWIVRGIGTACVVFGFSILFGTVIGVLFHIPFVGRIAEAGTFLLALAFGLPLAFITMIAAYLIANPIVLAIIVLAVVTVFFKLRQRGRSSQAAMKNQLDKEYGRVLKDSELQELEFIQLAQLASSESGISEDEEKFLRQWARKHRWPDPKFEQLLAKAQAQSESANGDTISQTGEEHLLTLVRLALADGSMSQYEMKSIRRAAKKSGFDDSKIRDLMQQALKPPPLLAA